MESKLSPLCKSIESSSSNSTLRNSLISQFISSFEANYNTVLELSKDSNFPTFCEILLNVLAEVSIPNPNSGPMPEVVNDILIFFNKIIKDNPIVLDIIAKITNLDILIPQFFSENVSNKEIVDVNVSYIFPPIKFIALVSSSKQILLTSTPSSNVLIIVLVSLLTNQQLAAWAAACLAGLFRNSPSFLSILKIHPLSACIKQKLTALLPSSDACVVVASLSATIPLYSLGDDAFTAMKAAVKYCVEDTVFPLSTKLCCWVIRDLIGRVGNMNEEVINQITKLPFNASGSRAFELINLLIDLIDMHYKFGSPEYMRMFFKHTIYYQENFVTTAGCQFLSTVLERFPDLFMGIDENSHLFIRTFTQYFQQSSYNDPEIIEALITQLRLLFISMQSKKLPDQIVELLVSQEEALFMDFIRHIENSDSYLCVVFFSFLLICSRSIESWSFRIKRILVDTQFPVLLAHVVVNSKNRRVISDALIALQYFINDCQLIKDCSKTFFFNSAVSGFLVMNQQAGKSISELNAKLTQEKHDYELMIQNLKVQGNQLAKEKQNLQNLVNEEKMNLSKTSESISKLQNEINEKNQVNQKIANKYKALKAALLEQNSKMQNMHDINKDLQNENNNLRKSLKQFDQCKLQLQSSNNENVRLLERINDLEAKISYISKQLKSNQEQCKSLKVELNEREEQYESVQKQCHESQQITLNLQNDDNQNKAEIQKLNATILSLQRKLKEETQKVGDMAKTVSGLQDENIKLKSQLQKESDEKQKYKLKKQTYLERIKDCEKEKRKWESIAKFNNHVATVKTMTVRDVYGDMTSNLPQDGKTE